MDVKNKRNPSGVPISVPKAEPMDKLEVDFIEPSISIHGRQADKTYERRSREAT